MNILMLNSTDTGGGAARSAYRLHRGLCGIGVNSRMLVQSRNGDDPGVTGPPNNFSKILAEFRPHLDYLPLKFYPHRERSLFSPAVVPEQIVSKIAGLTPDILHLHWINAGFIRLESLRKFTQPLVWTLHDSWAFTGGCHIPSNCERYRASCGKCPLLGSPTDTDLSRRVWNRKKKHWSQLDLTVVTPSRWLADCARSSALFENLRIEVIPNGLDIKQYRPFDQQTARNILELPYDKKLILFGGIFIDSDTNKGMQLLMKALQQLAANGWSDNAELILFGGGKHNSLPDFGLKARSVGRLYDDLSLALLYSAADVFVLPSIQENLPNTVMESMSCGTPCVAFDQGGMPDLIEHRNTGYLARPFESVDLAEGVAWILSEDDRRRRLGERSRLKAEVEFDLDKIAARYADLYQELFEK